MFDRDGSDIVWVSSDTIEEEDGTWERPFSSIETGLSHIHPGYTLVIKSGTYSGNVTIEVSGTVQQPVRITADENAVVEIEDGCWFFYDTSDLIVSNLIFKNAPFGAISVIGKCQRNRFESLHFKECGSEKKASCTMYFGGSGGANNIVEDCYFDGSDNQFKDSSIALMISEGDLDDGAPLRNFIIRKNTIRKHGYGILVGSSNETVDLYGHIIEYNVIEKCLSEGILIKCGDTIVRGNRIENCEKNSISIGAGNCSVIDSNRIVDCVNGVRVNGNGHTVANNCIVRCSDVAVCVCGQSEGGIVGAANLFIENNTFVYCGVNENAPLLGTPGIRIEPGTSCIIQKNLIYGQGVPIVVVAPSETPSCQEEGVMASPARYIVADNIASCAATTLDGVVFTSIEFTNEDVHFENSTGYGATGWVLTAQGFDPDIDKVEDVEDSDYITAAVIEKEDGELVIPGENDAHDLFDHLYGQIANAEGFEITTEDAGGVEAEESETYAKGFEWEPKESEVEEE